MKDGNTAWQGLTLSTMASKETMSVAKFTQRNTTFVEIAPSDHDLTPPRLNLTAGDNIHHQQVAKAKVTGVSVTMATMLT